MAYKYTISRSYVVDVAKELASKGIKVHKNLRKLGFRELRDKFSYLVNLAKEDWYKETGDSKFPVEQYDILRRYFAEQIVMASNSVPNNQHDWYNIFMKVARKYDAETEAIRFEKNIVNIENSDIYFDIINSIASKASNSNAKRFKAIKYTYADEGTGDLNREEFNELLSDDDMFALSRLAETYKDSKGFTADPLYWEIKNRAVAAGLSKLKSMSIGSLKQEPISASFNFDF